MQHLQTGEGSVRPKISELVINWHITEACNYQCRYCYAKWDGAGSELIHDFGASSEMLEGIFRFFSPLNRDNPLRQYMDWKALRINLAGGEPLLYPDEVIRILEIARRIGFSTSLITNGSLLNAAAVSDLAQSLSMLGISIDSANELSNRAIGREDRRARLLDIESLADLLESVRSTNPQLKLKVNTVVNALNCREYMGDLITRLAPSRWKVLRMLPVVTNDLAVSDAIFAAFVDRHHSLQSVMCVEDNANMEESYLMIDPHGRFFQNALGQRGYFYSRPINQVGAAKAFSEVSLSPAKFCERYTDTVAKEVVRLPTTPPESPLDHMFQ